MAYSKTTWVNGDTITAEKLNNIEDGIAANDTAIANLVPVALTGALDLETGAFTFSEITAADLYAFISAGKTFSATVDISGTSVVMLFSITAQKVNDEYDFALIASNGDIYTSGHLSATDAVVLTPAS